MTLHCIYKPKKTPPGRISSLKIVRSVLSSPHNGSQVLYENTARDRYIGVFKNLPCLAKKARSLVTVEHSSRLPGFSQGSERLEAGENPRTKKVGPHLYRSVSIYIIVALVWW